MRSALLLPRLEWCSPAACELRLFAGACANRRVPTGYATLKRSRRREEENAFGGKATLSWPAVRRRLLSGRARGPQQARGRRLTCRRSSRGRHRCSPTQTDATGAAEAMLVDLSGTLSRWLMRARAPAFSLSCSIAGLLPSDCPSTPCSCSLPSPSLSTSPPHGGLTRHADRPGEASTGQPTAARPTRHSTPCIPSLFPSPLSCRPQRAQPQRHTATTSRP